ncbi:YciI family protein [Lysobacter claricitrinus]|uniref:YciI family protein n=1 Tax=Lysobacter claricitrinus TaxID=3367728 RepID=UPI0037DB73DC
MKFLCLAYGSGADWKKLTHAEQETLLAADQRIRDRGGYISAVHDAATTVTAWDGTPKTEAASFATARLPMAGFSIIEANDLDEVVRLVAETPCARAGGAIEIRELLDTSSH